MLESWLGRNLTTQIAFVNAGSWAAMRTAADGASAALAPVPLDWAIGLTVSGTTLAQVASGSNDADFTYIANSMVNQQPTGNITMRLGWEMNGNYFPWYAVGNEANYIAAFQRVVGLFRAVSNRFRFVFCPNQTVGNGSGGYINPETMYPGNAYVDIIGYDVYYDSQYDGSNAASAFNYKVNAPYGMAWQADFARKNQKGLAVNEWGVNQDGQAAYIQMMAEWLRDQGYLYHNYWDSTDNFDGQLSSGQYPATGAQFIAEFSKSF